MSREKWLNGWVRGEALDTLLIGAGVHCICCGKFYGITSVVIEKGWKAPEKLPDWPFEEATCPVCSAEQRNPPSNGVL